MDSVAQPQNEGNVNQGNADEVMLIDLSSIAFPIFAMAASNPDPNHTSQQVVARVRALTAGYPRAVICCDGGRSFRADITPTYKANRPPSEAPYHHQVALAKEQLQAEGFPVWTVKGFEADDLIASATFALQLRQPVDTPPILIVSADKDLLQLVGPGVRAKSVRDGSIIDAEGVLQKFGVTPMQMRDYLTIVGDNSDNVKGVKGIGGKGATELLKKFKTLDDLYSDLEAKGGASIGLKPSHSAALREFKDSGTFETTRKLISLRTDVELPLDEIFQPRVERETPTPMEFGDDEPSAESEVEAAPEPDAPAVPAHAVAAPEQVPASAPGPGLHLAKSPQQGVEPQESVIIAPVDYERALDPRSMREAQILATNMYASRMFSAYGSAQAVLSTIMVGRELGVPAMSSLRTIHNIEGKHALSAALMVALILKSGLAEYFEPVSFDDKQATFVTKRKGARKEFALTHTIEMAQTAGLCKPNSNWLKIPTDMLVSRSQSRLARMIYPDLLAGLYTPEELMDASITARVA